MKKLVVTALAVVGLVLGAAPAQAWHGCCPPPCVTWCEKVVTCYKPEWRERDVTCTVYRPHYRTEIVKHKCTVMVPVWSDHPVSCMVLTYKPREVVRDMVGCRMVSVCVTDPCTGCSYTTCKPETYTCKVKCVVMDCVWVKKDYTVKVCSYKQEARVYDVKHVHCDWKPEQVTYKERYCVAVPYQAKVLVPVCSH